MIINDKEHYDKVRSTISMSNMRKLLDNKEYSVTKLAMSSGISVSTVNSYLNGQKLPSITTLVSIADYLGCNLDYLIGRANNPELIDQYSVSNPGMDELFFRIRRLPEVKVKMVLAYIEGLLDNEK